jgi:hypothetical protein
MARSEDQGMERRKILDEQWQRIPVVLCVGLVLRCGSTAWHGTAFRKLRFSQ